MLVAAHRQEICSARTTIYYVAYWVIPYMWVLSVIGLAFTVNDRRRRDFSLGLSMVLMMVICLSLRSNLNNMCGQQEPT
jgi:hypothetical protein